MYVVHSVDFGRKEIRKSYMVSLEPMYAPCRIPCDSTSWFLRQCLSLAIPGPRSSDPLGHFDFKGVPSMPHNLVLFRDLCKELIIIQKKLSWKGVQVVLRACTSISKFRLVAGPYKLY